MLALIGLVGTLALPVNAATVTGTVMDVNGNTVATNVSFKPLSTPLASNPNIIFGSVKSVTSDTNGLFGVVLKQGNYQVTVGSNAANSFVIAVPNDNSTNNWTDLTTTTLNYNYPYSPLYVTKAGTNSLSGPLYLTGTPTVSAQAVTKGYVDAITGNVLPTGVGLRLLINGVEYTNAILISNAMVSAAADIDQSKIHNLVSDLAAKLNATAAAGGDLTGNYPNPTLAGVISAGVATKVTYDAKGRIIGTNAITTNDLPGNLPGLAAYPTNSFLGASAAAGGDLTGYYPNPTLVGIVSAGTATKVTFDAKGRITATNALAASDIPTLSQGVVGGPQIASGAISNVHVAANAAIALSKLATDPLARANHTGTQLLSTISDAGTVATKNYPASGNAAAGEVVLGNDTRLTDSRVPTGSAGGDLTGTYPNPTIALNAVKATNIGSGVIVATNLAATGVASGTYSNATLTVNAQGQVTAVSSLTYFRNYTFTNEPATFLTNNTAAEFTLATATLPANALAQGRTVRVYLAGEWFNNTGAGRTMTVKIRLGGSTIYQDDSASIATSTVRRGYNFDFTLLGTGPNNQVLHGNYNIANVAAAATGTGDLATSNQNNSNFRAVGSRDSTTALLLEVYVTLSLASSSFELTRDIFTVVAQ